MFRSMKRFFASLSTRTSSQTFNEKRVVPDVVIRDLQEHWKVQNARRVFVRAYAEYHGGLSLKSLAAWQRIAQDYRDYCRSWHRWLPYYVLRAADSLVE
jgi:hypothetical protein